jgi:hypothetical protein
MLQLIGRFSCCARQLTYRASICTLESSSLEQIADLQKGAFWLVVITRL